MNRPLCSTLIAVMILFSSCKAADIFTPAKRTSEERKEDARISMFIGVDVSGSFIATGYFDDSLRFLAHYIKSHIEGYGDLEIPRNLFVGSIGGMNFDEAKTFFPIQTFEGKSVEEISSKLNSMFPKDKPNRYTDFNAYFKQIEVFVRNKNLLLRPISIVMVSDGVPDVSKKVDASEYRTIDLYPLENLARSITVRMLYTSAPVGMAWQTKVRRNRVKVWSQDAMVMKQWNASNIMFPGEALPKQEKFFDWLKDNVDFNVRSRRID